MRLTRRLKISAVKGLIGDGGIGTRGPGESQLETDRRLIRDRISVMKARVDQVRRSRETGAKSRTTRGEPTVAIVGYTNAGKSTLLSSMTAAKPKIADYAFTTLTPQLGMVEYRDGKSFCIADLPGIIEGAAEGKGLGHRFLRHIERNPVLVFLIPADSKDHKAELAILLNELEQYNPELLDKKFIIAISKNDMLDDELRTAIAKELPTNIPHVFISSVSGSGLLQLKDMLWKELQ